MLRIAVFAVAAVALLTACSDDEAGPQESDTAGYSAPPALEGAEPVAADAELEDCALGAGEHSVAGEMTNSSAAAADFVITLTWSNDDLENLGTGFVVLEDVAPGETESWQLTATVKQGAVFCVPNVLRGSLAD